MRGLAAERRRFGYRRLHWLKGREGVMINHKKFRHLYREERLQGAAAAAANVRWARGRR
jgi:putative transposase